MKPLQNKQIHKALIAIAPDYPLVTDTHPPMEVEQILKIGSLTIRCQPTRQAVLSVAEKYKKEVNFTIEQEPTGGTNPRPASSYYNELCREKEYQAAIDFWMLRHDAPFFGALSEKPVPLMSAKEFTPGFVVAHNIGSNGWNVTHLASGMTCSSSASTAKNAKQAFSQIDPDKLAEGIARAGDVDFQAKARKHYNIEVNFY